MKLEIKIKWGMDIYMYWLLNDEQDPEILPMEESFQVPKYPVNGETNQNGNSHSSPGVPSNGDKPYPFMPENVSTFQERA